MQAISEHPQAEIPQAQTEEETREKREADQAEPDASVPPTVSVKAEDSEATNQCEATNQSPSAQDWNTQKLSVWHRESLTESFIRFKVDSFV